MSTAFLPRLLFAISDADALHVLFFFLRDTEREREERGRVLIAAPYDTQHLKRVRRPTLLAGGRKKKKKKKRM